MNDIQRRVALDLISQACEPEPGRFTSDLPITAEVWLTYADGRRFSLPQAVLLTPHADVGIAALRRAVSRSIVSGLRPSGVRHRHHRYLATSESHLLANITLFDVFRLLPLTRWWRDTVDSAFGYEASPVRLLNRWLLQERMIAAFAQRVLDHVYTPEVASGFHSIGISLAEQDSYELNSRQKQALGRILNLAALQVALTMLGLPEVYRRAGTIERAVNASRRVLRVFASAIAHRDVIRPVEGEVAPLWQIARNRPAHHAMFKSRKTVKVDAASRVFDSEGAGVRWAVIDAGIDARHPGFIKDPNPAGELIGEWGRPDRSRVVKTMDFTRLASITSGDVSEDLLELLQEGPARMRAAEMLEEINIRLNKGHMLDWSLLEPLLEISHQPAKYIPPSGKHGTHVAGIIGADWRSEFYRVSGTAPPIELAEAGDVCGMCPEIELLDLRVFDAKGQGDEFSIIGALQYVRYLNQSRDLQYVHGVNLSVSLRHDVFNYGCGSTPVCLECDRLSGNGVVVVAAAGNYGYDRTFADAHLGGAYRGQSITDPGNAASAITVGATHRTNPYQYGVSFFSSRGPTGDGRAKPDLVAPGEKITSLLPDNGLGALDGTSMAAPHVSGVAALLLSRNKELMGQPALVKSILCQSASDLGRERAFQGAGLVDALRALQLI